MAEAVGERTLLEVWAVYLKQDAISMMFLCTGGC